MTLPAPFDNARVSSASAFSVPDEGREVFGSGLEGGRASERCEEFDDLWIECDGDGVGSFGGSAKGSSGYVPPFNEESFFTSDTDWTNSELLRYSEDGQGSWFSAWKEGDQDMGCSSTSIVSRD